MIVRQFLHWLRTAPSGDRAEATSALARAFLYSDLTENDRAAADPGVARSAFAPDTASLTETYAAAARLSPTVQAAEIGPVFHGLFRSGGDAAPVAPLVSSLWTAPRRPDGTPVTAAPVAGTAAPAAPAAPVEAGGELGLFQDQVPDARALFRGRV